MRATFSKNSILLAGGAFILRRVPIAAGGSAARSLSTSGSPRCNEGASFDEAPFGHAPPPDSESEDEQLMAASVGGTVLFGQSKVRAAPARVVPTAASLGPARWIGSSTHSGDFTRASLKQPVATPGDMVWVSIVAACREDPARLSATIAALHELYQQSKLTPPWPALHKLLSLCSTGQLDSDNLNKVADMMSGAAEFSKHQPSQ